MQFLVSVHQLAPHSPCVQAQFLWAVFCFQQVEGPRNVKSLKMCYFHIHFLDMQQLLSVEMA
jgi:hypothetical protein